MTDLDDIIASTTDEVFELAGGFAFTDEIAAGLNRRWRSQEHGPVIVSAIDLAWLLDGYARARLQPFAGHHEVDDTPLDWGDGDPTGAERYLADRLQDPEYREAYDEVRRHHQDFTRISAIGDQWSAGELTADSAIRQIRNIVG